LIKNDEINLTTIHSWFDKNNELIFNIYNSL